MRLLSIVCLILLCGCREPSSALNHEPEDKIATVTTLAKWQSNSWAPMVAATERLVTTTGQFLEAPAAETQLRWQSDWMTAHDLYLTSRVLAPELADAGADERIDPWPIEPGFLDSLPEYPESGIVNDSTLSITTEEITRQHLITDESEVALGFHVLEYYAFGRDLSDFQAGAISVEHRRQLIRVVTEILLLDIRTYEQSIREQADREQNVSYQALISQIHERCQLIFTEFNLLGEHGAYAGRSVQHVRVQLDAIRELMEEPVGLNHYLVERNPEGATVFNDTLAEALALLPENGGVDEASATRLLLLISSLSQQLEDYLTSLPGERQI